MSYRHYIRGGNKSEKFGTSEQNEFRIGLISPIQGFTRFSDRRLSFATQNFTQPRRCRQHHMRTISGYPGKNSAHSSFGNQHDISLSGLPPMDKSVSPLSHSHMGNF